MTDRSLSDLITRVERELSQVPGLAVQTYAKDAIAQKIISTFELIYSDRNWKRFKTTEQRTLDGVTGKVTTPFTEITAFDDIVRVYPATTGVALTLLPTEYNPLIGFSGGLPRYYGYSSAAGKLITVYPLNSSGDIIVLGQVHQAEDFVLSDTIPFDDLALVWGAAWQYAVDDATNPGAVAKFSGLFEARKKQLYSNQTAEPIALGGNRGVPTRWSE